MKLAAIDNYLICNINLRPHVKTGKDLWVRTNGWQVVATDITIADSSTTN
jgi:hypothetical protein